MLSDLFRSFFNVTFSITAFSHGYGPASNFRIVLGEHNQLVNEGTEKELSIKEIIIHEKYDSDTNDNDIALFRLPEDVQFNRYIKPICLPKEDVDANVLCITTGWGDTKCKLISSGSVATIIRSDLI